MIKFLKKYLTDIITVTCLIGLLISPILWVKKDAIAASLSLSNKHYTVYGNHRVIIGTATLKPGGGVADTFSTGLNKVFYASVTPGSGATAPVLTTINSNDGTMGTSNGDIYIEYTGADNTVTGNFYIAGK